MYQSNATTESEGRTMSLFEVGRLCLKVAGRDAGNKCLVVEVLDDNYVIVDGATRRKKVNVKHLEPLAEVYELKGTNHEEIIALFKKMGLSIWDKKSKSAGTKPIRQRKALQKAAPVEEKPVKAKKAKSEVPAEKPKTSKKKTE